MEININNQEPKKEYNPNDIFNKGSTQPADNVDNNSKIEIFDDSSKNNTSTELKKIPVNSSLFPPVIGAVVIDIIGTWVIFLGQDLNYKCVKGCISFSFLILEIIYFISVLASVRFVKDKPIIVGMYIFTASLVGLIFGLMFALLPFVLLFFAGAQVITKNWSSIESKERWTQFFLGLLISSVAVLFGIVRLIDLL